VDLSDVAELATRGAAASAEIARDGAVSEIEFDLDVEDDDANFTTTGGAEVDSPLDADELAAALAAARTSDAADEPQELEGIDASEDIELSEEVEASENIEADDAPESTPEIEPVEEPLAAAADEHADESFDLAAELAGAFDDDEAGDANSTSADASLQGTEEEAFASLFDDFKRGVTATLDEGDYETRYDLAIAYKEMGLTDDAISAFQICVPCPTRGLDSLQLMAQCQLDAGRVADAIGHLEQALSMDGLTPARRAGIYFDLGRAFCDAGDYARARANFETVTELDPTFPGVKYAVADLLERMADPQNAVSEDAGDDDEAFESFDDIVAEATAESVVGEVVKEMAAGEGFESFADIIEQAEDVLDAAAEMQAAESAREAALEAAELAEPEVVEPELVEEEPKVTVSPAEDPKPKKARKKISFV
jgi:tetratricopeptide (TPR) repeat protein